VFSKTKKAEGVVVGRKDFGEKDRIIVLFTKKSGKIRVLAKGIRKLGSSRAGSLELGNYVRILLFSGKGWDIISEAEVKEYFPKEGVATGGMIILSELINIFLPENEKNEKVFDEFLKTTSFLKKGKIETLVFFEAKLLELLGFGKSAEAEKFLQSGDLKQAHILLRERIENLAERKIKTLSYFQ